MKFNVPVWRVWLVTAIAALAGMLAISAGLREQWPVPLLALALLLRNVFQLWLFTRRPRDERDS